MTKLVRTARAGLLALSLLVGASTVIGGATTDPAIAAPADPAPAPSPEAPTAARAPSCPENRVCFWSGTRFTGTRRVVRPVDAGDCLELASFPSGYSSAYNHTFLPIREWQTAENTSDGTKCLDRTASWPRAEP